MRILVVLKRAMMEALGTVLPSITTLKFGLFRQG